MRRTFFPLATGLVLCLLSSSCRPERFFGPYSMQVPTELQERSVGRTFQLPLDAGAQRERDNLEYCLANEPDRELPCRCDYPVLTPNDQQLRLDYRVQQLSGESVNTTIWVGYQVASDAEPPALLPDLPRIDLLAMHLHRLQPGEAVYDAFTEDEMHAADLAWAVENYSICDSETNDRPAPLELLVGLAMTEPSDARVELEATFRVRP